MNVSESLRATNTGLQARRAVIAAGALWVAIWIWASRFALLDDALIHLRYAHLLWRTGFITFDGRTASYGTSSPLYVGLLALLSPLSPGALLAKAMSVAFYLGLLAVAVRLSGKAEESRTGWAAACLILISPMALQWFTDGMETGLVALFAVLSPFVTIGEEPGKPAGLRASSALSFLLGAAAVLLRAELALAIFFLVLGSLGLRNRRLFVRRSVPLALGGLGGVAALQILFGHVLADTAVAKQAAPMSFLEACYQVWRSTASSLTLGIGLTALWCGSFLLGLRTTDRRGRWALLSCNLLLPCVIAFIAARGQILHGVRHVLWIYILLISWNLAVLARSGARSPWPGKLPSRGWKILAAMSLVALWILEGRHVASILGARSRLFLAMRSEPLARLRETTGAGFDIGFIAFFTKADILDFSGLVNGRAVAALGSDQRLRFMASRQPDFLYVSTDQAQGLKSYLDLSPYRICYRYRTRTLTAEQIYFLAVRPGRLQVPLRCEQTLDGVLGRQGTS